MVENISHEQAYELDHTRVFHSWLAQAGRTPLTITKAQGCYVWDHEQRKILDFSSQLVNTNIGHQHPYVVEAIKAQADVLCTVAPQHVNDQRSLAAKLIIDKAPPGLSKVFFTNGGAEANEHALRMAKLFTGRGKVAALYRSYHGGSEAALHATGDPRRWAIDKGASDVVHFHGPYLYRSQFYAHNEVEECERALAHAEQIITLEGPENFAAIILETIPGTAGVMVPPEGYLTGIRALCDKFGIMLILDEVMAGFGRTGRWFALDHWAVQPDLITFAKGVNSGYVPLGGVILSEQIAQYFAHRPYPGGLTYSGHPLACAAAVATLTIMDKDGIIAHAADIGERVIGPHLRALADKHHSIGQVRGRGVFWCLELVSNQETKTPLAPYGATTSSAMKEILRYALAHGLLLFSNQNRIHVVPPCTITEAEFLTGLEILDKALALADAYYEA